MKTKTLYFKFVLGTISALLLGATFAAAQPNPTSRFKEGVLTGDRNISTGRLQKESLRSVHFDRKYYILLQFDRLPDPQQKKELAGLGIRLFDYIPQHSYLAEIGDSFSTADLKRYSVNSVSPIPIAFKLASRLAQHPDDYLHNPDGLIAVNWFGSLDSIEVCRQIAATGAVIIPTRIRPARTVFIRVTTLNTLQKITALPFISYLAPQPMTPRALNYNNRSTHGADALGASTGRNLRGDGVVIGVGDDTDPYTHIDFAGREIDRFAAPPGSGHGVHTSGIAGGGGILNPYFQGMAPHSTILSQYFSDVIVNAPVYLNDYDMILTTNSYTDYSYGCQYDGQYDYLANYTDAQAYTYPALLHSFAAGNDGDFTCTPFPLQYATIKSGFQSAKNVLTVGDTYNANYTINNASSCGPDGDGRIKPEIVAGGTYIYSTFPYNNYVQATGTSMSSPAVAGTLALLVQRYRQLHPGTDPPSALLKALICNTATDLGNPGPDYIFGFGSLNALAADQTLENNQFTTGSVNNGGSTPATITVPAGTQQLRVMLCWTDYPAAPYAATALVNNLDLTVTDPGSVLHHPLILNPDPAHVGDIAVEGIDTLNNLEQVVINNPTGGSFTITVNGTSVPQGPQAYALTYEIIQPGVQLLYPYGNETWVPGTTENIRWNAYGTSTNTFTIDYSADNGSTWTTISNTVPATGSGVYPWTVPAAATNGALIRVTANSTAYSDQSHFPITILGQPTLTASNPCQGYANMIWTSVPSATSYDVMLLKGDSMLAIANTTNTTYLLGNLNRDSSYWLSVRAVNGSSAGRRAIAANVTPSGGACALATLNNDYTIDSLIGPLTGRLYTSTQLGNSTPISVELKNLGTIPSGSSFTLSYQVNGGSIVTETTSAVVAPNSPYAYTFTTPYDFSAAGAYSLQIWVSYPGDPQLGNDTLYATVKQLSNAPLSLTPSYTEGFESAAAGSYASPALGFTGLDRCDFFSDTLNGRVRTFINTGFARTGDRCATLDAVHYGPGPTSDSLITTFNLSNYSASDQLWLDFYYQNQGIDFSLPGNRIWIRGNDQSPWIPVCTLDSNAANIGIYQPSPHIDITGILKTASPAQTVSSSFQIKFGEEGYTSTNDVIPDGNLDDGYSFDDITLTHATNDIGMLALVTPDTTNLCSLSNAETISVKVKNYSAIAATNISVTYSINGSTITETIPSINANDSVVYSFSQKADLSAWQAYTIRAWVHYPGDTYAANDTLNPVNFQTTPLISTFPYLEGFENNNGYWYTGGINSSWQWGTPQKTIIDKAANGSKCWVTSLTGDYNNNELSYLYSPCFDLSHLNQPEFSFSHIFQTEDDCDCDYHWAEYSTDGVTWVKLGNVGNGTNWYDNAVRQAWQQSYTKWHVSSYYIPVNSSRVRFRIVMNSDPATTYEGVAVDDIHIFDGAPIYAGPNITGGLAQPVSGNGWIPFSMGGGQVAAINPNGQDLGLTNVKVYFNSTGSVRHDSLQYYLDRNIVIQPSNPPSDSVSVRYYFLDSEADSLIGASGCPSCTTIADAYQSGVAQYSSPVPAEEDSTLANDTSGLWQFHTPHQGVSIIPNDNGYYAEYSVGGFSEFWIGNQAPVQPASSVPALLTFTAQKSGSTALLQWSAIHDASFRRYTIQKSTDSVNFTDLDSLPPLTDANPVHSYQYTDPNLLPGTTWYRLRMTDLNGNITWSAIRSVTVAGAGGLITVYPNPVSDGTLYISSTVNCRRIRLMDVLGRLILDQDVQGYLQTVPVGTLAQGIYLLVVDTDTGRQVQKVFVK
ncbi:MAG TPA: S8 family serine peptidase [Puia sp.]|nr:S8 family serine peptidase [Puia sp.]